MHLVFNKQFVGHGESTQCATSTECVQIPLGQGGGPQGQSGLGTCADCDRAQFVARFWSRLAKPQSAQAGGGRGPSRHIITVCKEQKALKRFGSVAERLLC